MLFVLAITRQFASLRFRVEVFRRLRGVEEFPVKLRFDPDRLGHRTVFIGAKGGLVWPTTGNG